MKNSVVLVIESLGGGGAQHVVSALANGWARRGVDVTVITFQDIETDVYALDPNVKRLVIGGSGDSANLFAAVAANALRLRTLRKALSESPSDLVVSFVGTTNILTVLASFGLRKKVVISERNDPTRQSLGRIWDVLRRLTYRRADLVTANSRNALNGLSGFVPDHKLIWLPNPLREHAEGNDTKIDGPTILGAGRLHHQKGFDVLLRAFALFLDHFPNWHLVILGEGPQRGDLETLSTELGVSDSVSMPGFSEPFSYYRGASVFAHPARYEGMPNAVLEAMSQGLPVIASDTQPGLEGYLKHGVNGLIVPSEDPSRLAASLVQLAGDPGLCRKLGAEARSAVSGLESGKVLDVWSERLGLAKGPTSSSDD